MTAAAPVTNIVGGSAGAYGQSEVVHAITANAIQDAKNRYGVGQGGVAVKALCGVYATPGSSPYATFLPAVRCQRCDRSMAARFPQETLR